MIFVWYGMHLSVNFREIGYKEFSFGVWGLNGDFRKYLSTFLILIINVPLCPQHRSSHAQDSIVWYGNKRKCLLAFSATLSSGTRECCLLNVYGPVLMNRIPTVIQFFSYPIYHKTKFSMHVCVIGWLDNSRCSKEFKQWSIYLVSFNSQIVAIVNVIKQRSFNNLRVLVHMFVCVLNIYVNWIYD